jgi:hypothetical protein
MLYYVQIIYIKMLTEFYYTVFLVRLLCLKSSCTLTFLLDHFLCKQYLILKIIQWLNASASGYTHRSVILLSVLVTQLLIANWCFCHIFQTLLPPWTQAIVGLRKDNFWKSVEWIFKLGSRWDKWMCPLGLYWQIIILQWNEWSIFNVVMTSHLLSMT